MPRTHIRQPVALAEPVTPPAPNSADFDGLIGMVRTLIHSDPARALLLQRYADQLLTR